MMRLEGYMGGGGSAFVDHTWQGYEYEVGGRVYHGDRYSPDARGDGGNPQYRAGGSERGVLAFYKPSDPSIAVLSPETYGGVISLFVICLSGIMVVAHLSVAWRARAFLE